MMPAVNHVIYGPLTCSPVHFPPPAFMQMWRPSRDGRLTSSVLYCCYFYFAQKKANTASMWRWWVLAVTEWPWAGATASPSRSTCRRIRPNFTITSLPVAGKAPSGSAVPSRWATLYLIFTLISMPSDLLGIRWKCFGSAWEPWPCTTSSSMQPRWLSPHSETRTRSSTSKPSK